MGALLKSVVFLGVIIAITVYAIVRIVLTVALAPEYSLTDRLFSFGLLLAELFILLHATGYAVALLRATRANDIGEIPVPPLPYPPPGVAILVAARHEPREVLEETFRNLTNIRYPSKTIYFLDDSSDEKYLREAEEICLKFNLKLFRRQERHGAKAGIVNDCLKGLTDKYVAVFDADQNALPGFLDPLIPILEANPKLAFIQTPQFYSNIDSSHVARGATFQQAVFYEYICEAKGTNESMFCCGTNVVFRREALLSVGGMDESVVTEDFATSVKLHMAGWKSLYYNHVGTFGMGPETLAAYFKQQSRWARGTVGVMRKVLSSLARHPLSLRLSQWWEYMLSSTYYFVGIAFVLLMICPVAYLFFDVPSFLIHTDIYISVFVPYFSLSLGVFFVTLRARRYRARDLFTGQMLTYVAFPVLAVATAMGLLGAQGTFGITDKGRGRAMPWTSLWPQFLFMFLNFAALVWGINRYWYERDASILINCVWALYHFAIMCSVFYFNEELSEEAR
ncbi:MAG TPA: glycosyltransferase [bacterium]|nr:glycosyltransferase [bacterium]